MLLFFTKTLQVLKINTTFAIDKTEKKWHRSTLFTFRLTFFTLLSK